jgi:hypothetical protein
VGIVPPEQVVIMIIAVIVSIIVMMFFSGAISTFIKNHPSMEVLALGFPDSDWLYVVVGRLAPGNPERIHLFCRGLFVAD